MEHSTLSRDGVGIHGRYCICIYRTAHEDGWSFVIFEADRLLDVKVNAFATDTQALLSAHLKLASQGLLVEDSSL